MSSARELHVGVPTLNPWLPGSKSCFPRLCRERNAFRLQRVDGIPDSDIHSSVLSASLLPPILAMEPRAKCCANKLYLNPLVPSLFVCFVLFSFLLL